MINVVVYIGTVDTGGQGWRIKRAFDRYQPDFAVRSIHSDESYFQYPADMAYHAPVAYSVFAEADVVHMRNGLEGLRRLSKQSTKPFGILLHHHGSRFRDEHARIAQEARKASVRQVASTIDLTLLEPDVYWLPSPFDFDELWARREIGLAAKRLDPLAIRICHAPTNRTFKGTEAVIEAVKDLSRSGLPVILDLIERQPYEKVLLRKAKADIFIDQIGPEAHGYGNNAIEAWGMNIPVVSQVVEPATRERMCQLWGQLPFVEATPETLFSTLMELATDVGLRAHWGLLGATFARDYHDEKTVSNVLADHYRAVMRG